MANRTKKQYVEIDVNEPLISNSPTEVQGVSCGGVIFTFILNLIFGFVLPMLVSFYTVNPQEEALVLFWGRLVSIKKRPGIYWFNVMGRNIRTISTRTQTIDIKKTTVVDANGNPIIVSGVATFKITNTMKAAFDVENPNEYMERQAMATLKRVCSKYPYESKDGISLQTEADQVSREMVAALQEKAQVCGVKVLSYELADLQYAPEIAQGMLVRQQAQALLDARKVIVDGAVSIVTTAMTKLKETGVALNEKDQTRLVSNLLAVICSDARVQPMFSISESVESSGDSETHSEMLKMLQTLNLTLRARNGQ